MNAENRQAYERIEKALEWLAENYERQPSLAQVASRIGLSEYHFQRMFTRWVGVSPKKLVQYLTLKRAKRCLAESQSVLEATFASGLSGPGRLHDLFVTLEAMTPGEYKMRGEGLQVRYGYHHSPFGEYLIGITSRGVCSLAFCEGGDRGGSFEQARRGLECAEWRADDAITAPYAERIFPTATPRYRRGEPLHLFVRGTALEVKVWEALLSIPCGAVCSYSDVARKVENPRAWRAVATAIGANPIAYLIPCHRVIRKSGVVGDYRWGRGRKLALLSRETAREEDPSQMGRASVSLGGT